MDNANTAMMVDGGDLNFFGDSAGPVTVFDAASPLLATLGKSDGSVRRGRLTFGRVEFSLVPVKGSKWMLLHHEETR